LQSNLWLNLQGLALSFAKSRPKGIVLVARSAEILEIVKQEILAINENIKVLVVPADLQSEKSVAALWETVKKTFGHADVLINNAASAHTGLLAEAPAVEWWSNFVRYLTSIIKSC
jgi:short-subunit dehydrogenase